MAFQPAASAQHKAVLGALYKCMHLLNKDCTRHQLALLLELGKSCELLQICNLVVKHTTIKHSTSAHHRRHTISFYIQSHIAVLRIIFKKAPHEEMPTTHQCESYVTGFVMFHKRIEPGEKENNSG